MGSAYTPTVRQALDFFEHIGQKMPLGILFENRHLHGLLDELVPDFLFLCGRLVLCGSLLLVVVLCRFALLCVICNLWVRIISASNYMAVSAHKNRSIPDQPAAALQLSASW
jgi:hypothetical protein